MVLLELSDGLSNEACVSWGNKLVCSDAVTLVAPPVVHSLICAVFEGGVQNKAVREEVKKKKGNGMSHATCFLGAFTFHFSRWEFYTC